MVDGRVHNDIAKLLLLLVFWLKKRQSVMKTKSKHLHIDLEI